jgi:signal transduction histidine kinase
MDTWRVDPVLDLPSGPRAGLARFGAAGLSLRLAALRQSLERDYSLTVAINFANAEAADGLAPDLTDAIHALLQEAAVNAALHAQAAMVRVGVHVNGGVVMLSVEDDGKGFPFHGTYDLHQLQAFGVGPQWLAHGVADLGGTLTLDSRGHGARIEISLPREGVRRPPAAHPVESRVLAVG